MTLAEEIERRRLEWFTRTPPTLTDGEMRVLREMAGDFTVHEWARRFDVTLLEVERACAWLGVQTQTREKK